MFCPNCGVKTADNAKFCESCGSAIKETANSTSNATAPAQPQSYQPQPQQSSYQVPVQPSYPPPPPRQEWPSSSAAASNAGMGAQVMSVGQYIGTLFLASIPIVGFILMLIWAFGSDVNPNKKNFAKAMLILGIIGFVLAIIYAVVLGSMFRSMFRY